MSSAYRPLNSLHRAYKYWWLIALAGILGGLAGWLYSLTRPPIYQSSFEFAAMIDAAQTGPLSELEYDRTQQAIGRVVYSDSILDAAVETLEDQGVQVDIPTLRRSTRQEWLGAVWVYTVRHPDPEIARQIAEAWGQSASAALTTALQQADEAAAIRRQIDALVGCAVGDPEAQPDCAAPEDSAIVETLAQLETRRAAAEAASLGLSPALTFQLTAAPETPTEPAALGRASIVFSSAMIGLLAGVWLVNRLSLRVEIDPL